MGPHSEHILGTKNAIRNKKFDTKNKFEKCDYKKEILRNFCEICEEKREIKKRNLPAIKKKCWPGVSHRTLYTIGMAAGMSHGNIRVKRVT